MQRKSNNVNSKNEGEHKSKGLMISTNGKSIKRQRLKERNSKTDRTGHNVFSRRSGFNGRQLN